LDDFHGTITGVDRDPEEIRITILMFTVKKRSPETRLSSSCRILLFTMSQLLRKGQV
jgi:hypothetical protein